MAFDQSTTTPSVLSAGTPAPAFALLATPDQHHSLSDLRGSPVILAFYPADWSPVCGDQMGVYAVGRWKAPVNEPYL